ncbi:MAG: pilus assembly protein N-terminal domain-containing protein [Pirellulaceae bacterium]|nr:pilus assembly protein N-terminal domain-containing protein [Pirellulaceae bacterium]
MTVGAKPNPLCGSIRLYVLAILACAYSMLGTQATAHAQPSLTSQWGLANSALNVTTNGNRQLLEMIVNTSREIVAEHPFRRVRIQNPEVIKAIPLEGGNRLQVSAVRTGVTQVDLLGADESVATVEVMVMGDVRELETILRRTFPQATLELTPIAQGIIVNGFVSNSADVDTLTLIAQQYFPNVINRVTVTGIHTIQLQTQVMEISRTKLRTLGVDWALSESGTNLVESSIGATTLGKTFGWTVVDGATLATMNLEALKRNNLIKVLASPTLTAVDGRPASFNVGGEIPIVVPSGLGQVTVQFREFGTRLDYVAKVLGNGKIYLEVRPYVSELDPSRSVTVSGISVPGLRSRFLETGVELNAGQTLALGGLLQVRTEVINTGIPGLGDVPYLGALFRKVREEQNEIELLITVTPDFAGPMDPHQVPRTIPGMHSDSPNDKELYLKGYIEVPVSNHCELGFGPQEIQPVDMHGQPASSTSNPTISHTQSQMLPPRPAAISVGPNAPMLADSGQMIAPAPGQQTAAAPQPGSFR